MARRFLPWPTDDALTPPRQALPTGVSRALAWLIRREERRAQRPRPAWRRSLQFALDGLRYALGTQRNLQIQAGIAAAALGAAVALRLPGYQVALIVALAALVLFAELVNTVIESTLDLHVGAAFDPAVKHLKDMAAAAVLVVAMGAAALGTAIFLPALKAQWPL